MRSVIIFLIASVFLSMGIFLSNATIGQECAPCNINNPYHISPDAKVFVLTNKDTVVIYNGQPFYFNEADNKTSKARRP